MHVVLIPILRIKNVFLLLLRDVLYNQLRLSQAWVTEGDKASLELKFAEDLLPQENFTVKYVLSLKDQAGILAAAADASAAATWQAQLAANKFEVPSIEVRGSARPSSGSEYLPDAAGNYIRTPFAPYSKEIPVVIYAISGAPLTIASICCGKLITR